MNQEAHARAEGLIAQERVEGISADERLWLEAHLRECDTCAGVAGKTDEAVRSVRRWSVPLPRGLAGKTQFRVRLRAQELRAAEPRWRMLWVISGLSWICGAATAPYVWRGLEWVGRRTGVPSLVWEMGFGLWWALPAIVVAVILLVEYGDKMGERDLT